MDSIDPARVARDQLKLVAVWSAVSFSGLNEAPQEEQREAPSELM